MKILVANLGSTSFKYRLYDLEGDSEQMLARGAIERIGSSQSKVTLRSARGEVEMVQPIADHGDAVQICLDQLIDPKFGVLERASDVAAIGFKAVHARNLTGVHRVDEDVLEAMEAFADVAPAHNPPYTKAMRMLAGRFPRLPLVAAFETGFHRTIPEANQRYAVPDRWATALGVRRWGFHGASHRYIAGRMAQLLGRDDLRLISCHLGGSSSLCAIREGKSVACSLGMSPQSGLPHNNRVGDFDTFALLKLLKQGLSVEDVFKKLGKEGGMLGMSGVSPDMRDIEKAAATGDQRAHLAIEAFVESVRSFIGQYLVILGGCDLLAFTGGIGENGIAARESICRHLEWAGIALDPQKNQVRGREEKISSVESDAEIWILPTNEELIVARQTESVLTAN